MRSKLTLREWQGVIGAWADDTFPDRTVHGSVAKLVLEEIPEFLLNRKDPGEYADMLIMILDIAHQLGIDVEQALADKHHRNTRRTWKVTEDGTYRHASEGEPLYTEQDLLAKFPGLHPGKDE